MPDNRLGDKTFLTRLVLILTQVSLLFACQPREMPVAGSTLPALTAPSTTSQSARAPATPSPEEWLAFVPRDFQGRAAHPNPSILDMADTGIAFVREDGSSLFAPEMFERFHAMVEYSLAWSPDGKYLLFDWSNFGPTMTRMPVIQVADARQRKVTPAGENRAWVLPSWSPDSEWFAASLPATVTDQEGKEQDTYSLFRVNPDTFQKDRLTTSTSSDLYPSWSPNGQWIAFLRFTPGSPGSRSSSGTACGRMPDLFPGCQYADLYITRREGGRPELLLQSVYIRLDQDKRDDVYNNPSWSPNSKWLAVLTGAGQPDITLINIETGETRLLSPDPAVDIYPAWSPDGSRLAFVSDREGNEEIYLISPDGSDLVNLTNHAGSDFNPVWSPSGHSLAFLSDREEARAYRLHVMNADGTEPRMLYDGYVFTRPSWFPRTGVDIRTLPGFGSE